jgi:hypothetical protein
VHSLRQTYHWLSNRLGRSQCYLVTRLKWNLDSICLEIVLIMTQDRYIACAKCITGSEIILDAVTTQVCYPIGFDFWISGTKPIEFHGHPQQPKTKKCYVLVTN